MATQKTENKALKTRWVERKPYWLRPDGVKKIEELKNAVFMGHWCVKTPQGWSEQPVDVFYQAKPDRAKGHTQYFGLYLRGGRLMICDACSAFSEPMTGAITADGEVLVSRYRHDCQQKKGVMVDGGRDYFRSSLPIALVTVKVKGSEFKFKRQLPA